MIRVTLEEITVGIGVGERAADPQPTGKYRWNVWDADRKVASSFTHYDSPESCVASLQWLIEHASSLSIEPLLSEQS